MPSLISPEKGFERACLQNTESSGFPLLLTPILPFIRQQELEGSFFLL